MQKLTSIQKTALDYIRQRIDRSGAPPTLREICEYMGYSAVGSAQDLVAALRKKGYLSHPDKQAARSISLTDLAKNLAFIADEGDDNTYVIPCLGSVPAGNPLEAIENKVGTIRISISQFRKPRPRADELFALQAAGDSMVGAGILDGDWLVAKSQTQAKVGNIVVARVDGEATVKRLHKDKGQWFLMPENPDFKPIKSSEQPFEIVGKIMALQRVIL